MSKRGGKLKKVLARTERGATAVVVAFAMLMLMGAGAIGYDISKLLYERQQVRAAIDAAAQAGASALPDVSEATNLAKAYFAKNFPDATPLTYPGNIAFYCVVANADSSIAGGKPDPDQIPATCDPGSYDASKVKCSKSSCAVPCGDEASDTCNTMTITYDKQVEFMFGPAINIPYGTTGAQTTLSCLGSCGGEAPPNPMNVVVMADRTPSMFNSSAARWGDGDKDLDSLKSGLESMLKLMNPKQQYVAFGAIHKSVPRVTTGDRTTPPTKYDTLFNYTTTTTTTDETHRQCSWVGWKYKCEWVTEPVTKTVETRLDEFNGIWVPVEFSDNYLNVASDGTKTLNTATSLYQSVHNLNYSNLNSTGYNYTTYTQSDGYYGNTHLAAALKGAGRYLLGKDLRNPNNVAALDAATDRINLYGPAKNVIIFETDGAPAEVFTNASSDSAAALSLDNSDDIGSKDGARACRNFQLVADQIKGQDVTIITIGYGAAASGSATCGSSSTRTNSVLASVASPVNGVVATASTDCAAENSDGDNYYCAADGSELEDVFAAAMGSLTGGTKFMAIDGLSD